MKARNLIGLVMASSVFILSARDIHKNPKSYLPYLTGVASIVAYGFFTRSIRREYQLNSPNQTQK